MSKSITKQLEHAVHKSSALGDSKRTDKFNPKIDTTSKVYSRMYKRDMLSLAKNFGKFLKEQYPNTKRAYDIRPEMIQAYVNSKTATCNDGSLQRIATRMAKLEKCCKHAYAGSSFDWNMQKITIPKSTKNDGFRKNIPIPLDVSKYVIEKSDGMRSEVSNAIRFSVFVGMRVNETVNIKVQNVHFTGGEFGYGYVEVSKGPGGGAKGGKPRMIPIIDLEAKRALQQAIFGKVPDQYVSPRSDGKKMTSGYVSKVVREIMDSKYGTIYKGNRCHGMRKSWAQQYYDIVRTAGCSRKEAVEKTNVVLGHGSKRGIEMVKMYVANIW